MKSLGLGVILLLIAPLACAGTYRFDTVHSQVVFSVGHDGFSNPVGMLHIADGWMRFDPDHWNRSFTELDIDLGGVDMGDADWSKAVKGRQYLDVAKARYAHFVSTSVRRTGKHTGILHGTLTLHGVSQPVSVIFKANRHGFTIYDFATVAGFSGYALLDRTGFGMTSHTGVIGKQVTVRLEIEAISDRHARRDYQRKEHARASEK